MRQLRTLRIRAYAKINLFLNVVGKRDDGYHNLETVFQSIDLYDEIILRERDKRGVVLHCDHPEVPSNSSNLAYGAAQAIRNSVGGMRGLEITIVKRIPVAAGLAGGSANAAAVLHGINALFSLEIPQSTLLRIGRELGADVPFCLIGGTSFGTGIGDVLTPLPPLTDVPFILINPGISVSTSDIFRNLHIPLTKQGKESIIIRNCVEKRDTVGIGKNLYNILEIPVFSKHPELSEIKSHLSTQDGTLGALMSGSGATIFALMQDTHSAQRCQSHFKNTYGFCITTKTCPNGVHIDN